MNGFLDEVGKLAGAYAAEKGLSELDPNANMLEKLAGAVAGFEGTKLAENAIGEKYQEYKNEQNSEQTASDDNLQADNQQNDDNTDYADTSTDSDNSDNSNDNDSNDDADNS